MTKEAEQPEKGAPEAEAKDKDVKAAKPEAPADDKDPGDEATPGGGNDADKQKKPHWSQKRIDELTYNRRQAERDRDYWRELALRHAQQPQAQPAQPQAPATNKPSASQFATTEDYLEALADWKSEQKLQDWDRKRRETAEKEQRQQAAAKVHQSFAEREQKAREKYEDFEEVAYHIAPINEVMAEVIRRSELGPEIAYFLGKNPDKGQQIASMTDGHSVALAIGRIEAQLEMAATPPPAAVVPSAPQKPAPTSAPPPPKTLSGSAPVQKRQEDMSTEEWVAWRREQIRKKRA